jgi:hypothetical protein
MSGLGAEAVVVAATTIRVPAVGCPADSVFAIVDSDQGHRMVILDVDPEQLPKPGDTVTIE